MEELLIMLQRARHRPIPNQDRLCQAITTTLFALYSRMPHHIKYVSQFFNHLSHSNSPRAYYNLQKHVGNSGNSRVLKSVERTFDLQQRRCYPLEGGQKETSCKNVQKRTNLRSIELALWLQALLVPVLFAFSTQGSTDIFSSVLTRVFMQRTEKQKIVICAPISFTSRDVSLFFLEFEFDKCRLLHKVNKDIKLSIKIIHS